MKDSIEELEKQVAELRAQVATLQKVVIYGLIVFGALAAFGPLIPVVAAILGGIALFVFVFATLGALLGSWTGRALRAKRHPPIPFPTAPSNRGTARA